MRAAVLLFLGFAWISMAEISLNGFPLNSSRSNSFMHCAHHMQTVAQHPAGCNHHFILSLHHVSAKTTHELLPVHLPQLRSSWHLGHNTILVEATHAEALKAVRNPLVRWMGSYQPRHKLARDTLTQCDEPSGQRTLYALLGAHHNVSMLKWSSQLRLSSPVGATARLTSARKAVVSVPCHSAISAAHWLAGQPEVVWVERYYPSVTHNRNMRWLTQSYKYPETPMWDYGLFGENQILAVADTGLDVHSCFFADTQPVLYFDNPSLVLAQAAHRKLVGYFTYMDDSDAFLGHGTSMIGSAAGRAWPSYTDPSMKGYDGNAFAAKVLVIDLGCTGKNNCTCTDCDCVEQPGGHCRPQTIGATQVHPPHDWGAWMLSLAYNNGARVFLAPFGDTGPAAKYNTHAMEVDQFVWQNQDFLPVLSAGDRGEYGLCTLAPSATSKNALVVGASGSEWSVFSANGAYWSLEQAAWRARDELISTKCGSCATCNSQDCIRAKAFRPQRFTDSPDNCCNSPLAGPYKEQCCSIDFSSAHGEEGTWRGHSTFSGDNVLSTSARGPTLDGRIKPDVVALAAQVVSARADWEPAAPVSYTDLQDFCLHRAVEDEVVQEGGGSSLGATVGATFSLMARNYLLDGNYPRGLRVESDAVTPNAALVKALVIHSGAAMHGLVDLNGKGAWQYLPNLTTTRQPAGPSAYAGFGRIQGDNVFKFRIRFDDPMNLLLAGCTLLVIRD